MMIAISEMGRRGEAGFPGWRDEGQLNWRHIELEMPLRHPGRHGQEGTGHRANSRVERRVAFPWKHGHSEALKALFLKMRRGWAYLSF